MIVDIAPNNPAECFFSHLRRTYPEGKTCDYVCSIENKTCNLEMSGACAYLKGVGVMKDKGVVGKPLTLEQIRERYSRNNIIGYAGIIQHFGQRSLFYGLCDYREDELEVIWNCDSDFNYKMKDYGRTWVLWDHIPDIEEMKEAERARNERFCCGK